MLVQLFRNNLSNILETLDYEVYNGYYNDNLGSSVFTAVNLLESGLTSDLTNLITSTGGFFTPSATNRSMKIYGFFRAKYTGTYRFFTMSKDASHLVIDGSIIVDNGTTHNTQIRYGTTNMVAGRYYSITIYYGNSGSGTAEFSAGFGFIPEQNSTIYKYPSGVITSLTSNLSGNNYGNGTYIVSASSVYDTASNNRIINAFDGAINNNAWVSANNVYSTTNGLYTGNISTTTTTTTILGEWLQIELPYVVKLSKLGLGARTLGAYSPPLAFTLVANNNVNDTWVKIFETTNTLDPTYSGDGIWSAGEVVVIDINSNNFYKNYRIIVQRVAPYPSYQRYCAIGEFEIFSYSDIMQSEYVLNATGLTTYYETNPTTQAALTTNAFPLIIEDDTLQGKFKVSPLALYFNRENFSAGKHQLFYIASDDLFNNFNATYKNYIQLHEKPVVNDNERKRFTQFSSDMSFECELNGRIEVRFRRANAEPVTFRYAMLILDVERI
jgi:hypothetical protein